MKVRIGYGLGVATGLHDERSAPSSTSFERLRFDSLWLSERIGGEGPDPVTAIAYGAGRTERLKFGMSVLVLPGRNPVVLAKELATIDRLSGGRLLPAFGLGVADPHEQQAFGVERGNGRRWFDESMAVLRGAWAAGTLTHHGDRYHYDDLRVLPKPAQDHLDVWLGGIAPASCAASAGWPTAGCPRSSRRPTRRRARRRSRRSPPSTVGRSIPEHYGVLIPTR